MQAWGTWDILAEQLPKANGNYTTYLQKKEGNNCYLLITLSFVLKLEIIMVQS